jgi:hypothetical protein
LEAESESRASTEEKKRQQAPKRASTYTKKKTKTGVRVEQVPKNVNETGVELSFLACFLDHLISLRRYQGAFKALLMLY